METVVLRPGQGQRVQVRELWPAMETLSSSALGVRDATEFRSESCGRLWKRLAGQ
jgi:hypothetical protein